MVDELLLVFAISTGVGVMGSHAQLNIASRRMLEDNQKTRYHKKGARE